MTCVKTHKPATNKAGLVKDWQDERIQRGLGLEWFTSIDSLFVLSSFKLKFLPMGNPSKIIRTTYWAQYLSWGKKWFHGPTGI